MNVIPRINSRSVIKKRKIITSHKTDYRMVSFSQVGEKASQGKPSSMSSL